MVVGGCISFFSPFIRFYGCRCFNSKNMCLFKKPTMIQKHCNVVIARCSPSKARLQDVECGMETKITKQKQQQKK